MVVLVDDNELFRSALAANLRDDGYYVLEFENGHTVPVDSLDDIDALLSEYMMPGEDGLSLARRFHRRHPSVPVIVMTRGAADLDSVFGPLDYVTVLPKPLDYETLSGILRGFVGHSSRRGH